jgi:urea transporter
MLDLVVAVPLRGLSQIFVVESALSGLGIAAAISSYSPSLALHALMGSAVGSLTGLVCTGGAAMTDVTAGLWGFNSALTSMGIAVFMVHSSPASKYNNDHISEKIMMEKNDNALLLVSMGGAVASASVFGALQKVFGTVLGAPCLTLPFCITMSGCYLLTGRIPGLELAESPHSPERNQSSSSSSSSV